VTDRAPPRLGQGRLFRKYLLFILALVSGALLASGGIGLYFSYQEQKTALGDLQHEKAIAAASRIEQYIRQIEQQLAFAALPQLDAGDVELRRIEFLKLLRQVPEVTDIAQLDGSGREQVLVSRLGMDVMRSGRDRSGEPAFKLARRGKPWFGPVYFRKETEPYMTIAIRSGADGGPVTIADVNLKFIWDVVSRIRIGEKGKAYVVDGNGFLVADPDIGLVLRKTSMSALPHVRDALDRRAQDEQAEVSRDLAGTEVLTSHARIDPLNWIVFAEQPLAEATARLSQSVLQTALLLLVGLVISALCALALARGMVRPIRTLADGAQRIGEGELDQTIVVRTGDELEGLADRFNRMTTQLRESYASLERKVEERTHELANSLEQQTAISEILRVISSSPTDVQPVLDAVAERAALLCDAPFARVMLIDGDVLMPAAEHSAAAFANALERTEPVPLRRTSLTGRAALDRQTVHYADIASLLDTEFPDAAENMRRFGCRAVLVVPLMREGGAYGGIVLARQEAGLFPPDQVALVETFARQAAIAIDNVRLFNQTREALDQQTAIAEILRVISSSPTDVQPVLDAVAHRARNLCDAAQSVVALVDGSSLRFVAGYGTTATAVGETIELSRGLVIGRAVIDCTTVHVADLATESETEYRAGLEMQRRIGHHTTLSVPLMREGTAIGAIALWRMQTRPFTKKQVALVETFADQAAIAIDNVRLFNQTREALDQQTATSEVLKTISRTTFELQPVLETLIENATTLCKSDKGGIYLRRGEVYELVAAHGAEGSQIEFMKQHPVIPGQGSVVGMVAKTGQVVHIEDAQNDPAYTWHEAQQVFGFRSIFGVPMVREGELVGAFVMWRKEVRPFSTRERDLVATFADQAVIAIQNVRLLSETKEALDQQTATAEVVKAISRATFDLRSVLEILIENACRVSRARKGFVLVPEGNAYAISVNRGATIEEVQFMLARYRLSADNGSNVPAKFLLTESDQTRGVLEGHTVLVDRVLQVPDVQAASPATGYRGPQVDLRTMLCVPMLVEGTPIGVLSVWRNEVAPFSEREIELLRTFADQAVIAIQNARLVGEIRQKSAELEVANKHKSAFLASMSHELRTPLNAIIGFSEVLLARLFGELNDKQDDYLKDIHSSGKHLLNLINDVLDLSKVEAGRMDLELSRFDLRSALSDAMTLIRERAMKHGIALGLDVEPTLGEIDADERKFKQILLNLLSNAVKFTPDGGRVDVVASRVDGAVQISVRDTGIGIAPQDRQAVFEEFRQAGGDYTSKQEGTGLGLALTRRFVELHGGRIWLASEVGKGSTFFFTIPMDASST
jgi:signal transduction histidine kinase